MCIAGVGFIKARIATSPNIAKFEITTPNASPAVNRKLVAYSSSTNFTGGLRLESSMKNSNILGINEQFATDNTRKNSYTSSGIGSVTYAIMFKIYIVSTSIQNRAGLNDNAAEAPLEEAPPAPAAGPTTAAVTPAAPAALVTADADVIN